MHQVARVEIQGSSQVAVHMYSTDPAAQTGQLFTLRHTMPIEAFSAVPYPGCVMDWLVSAGGPYEGGVVVEDDELTLGVKQDRLTAQVNKERDARIAGGLLFQGLPFDTDEVSLRNIMGTAQMATLSKMAGQPFAVDWRCADNSMANLDADTFIALAETVMQHVQACYTRSWELKADIAVADDTTIDTIDISAGWPPNA
jgi:hypothetical protein